MREMLEAGVHFGHQTRFWNPKMALRILRRAAADDLVRLSSAAGRTTACHDRSQRTSHASQLHNPEPEPRILASERLRNVSLWQGEERSLSELDQANGAPTRNSQPMFSAMPAFHLFSRSSGIQVTCGLVVSVLGS